LAQDNEFSPSVKRAFFPYRPVVAAPYPAKVYDDFTAGHVASLLSICLYFGRHPQWVVRVNEIDAYDYELPQRLIAQRPLACRSDARLMLLDRRDGTLWHHHVRDLPELLRARDALVLNDTRVVPARVVGRRHQTGGRWEGLVLAFEPNGLWRLLCKTRGRQQPGDVVMLVDRALRDAVSLTMIEQAADGSWVARVQSDEATLDLLERIGRVPLPHYIRGGEMIDEDRQTYQTVFAEKPGAVAAPTAGLHFTPELLKEIEDRGVSAAYVTLHVGVGTFRPIKAHRLAEHEMHSEWGAMTAQTADTLTRAKAERGRIVAVGTTTVRLLETVMQSGPLRAWSGDTSLFIRPPFTFRAVDALLTNFHLPRSTLLVLVRTFGGDALIKAAYAEAVREEYRFYSYGDAMLIV
jgi:S-adenosylmethionine:tRNA ribosyltransferase-isomerase